MTKDLAENVYYVYIYRNQLNNNEPFYVGKGKGNRAFYHLLEPKTKNFNRRKYNIISKIRNETNEIPIIEFFVENITSEEACQIEVRLIKEIGRKNLGLGPLTNLTDGGEGAGGYKHTKETKLKMSESSKGKSKTLEHRRKMTEFNQSDEGRLKNSQGNKGKKQTIEDRKKKSIAATGKSNVKGFIWCHDPDTFKTKMLNNIDDLPFGYVLGRGPRLWEAGSMPKNAKWYHDPLTNICKYYTEENDVPDNFKKGRGKHPQKTTHHKSKGSVWFYDPTSNISKCFKSNETIPEGFVKGRPSK